MDMIKKNYSLFKSMANDFDEDIFFICSSQQGIKF